MPDLEKITINLTPVDLGRIEVLVEQGFYSNRAEFIRTAIQTQLSTHGETLREVAQRDSYVVGAVSLDRHALEAHRKAGRKLRLNVIGFASLADDVTPELARASIEKISVHGIFRAPAKVKHALEDRTS